MEMEPAVLRPATVEACLLECPLPYAAEVVGGQCASLAACAAGGGEHQPGLLVPELVVMLAERVAGLLVQRDRPPAGLGLGALDAAVAAAAGVAERSNDP